MLLEKIEGLRPKNQLPMQQQSDIIYIKTKCGRDPASSRLFHFSRPPKPTTAVTSNRRRRIHNLNNRRPRRNRIIRNFGITAGQHNITLPIDTRGYHERKAARDRRRGHEDGARDVDESAVNGRSVLRLKNVARGEESDCLVRHDGHSLGGGELEDREGLDWERGVGCGAGDDVLGGEAIDFVQVEGVVEGLGERAFHE